MAGGKTFFKRNSTEILIEFLELKYFLKFRSYDRSGKVSVYLNGLSYQMSCGILVEFWETKTHSKTRNGCHMSTLWVGAWQNVWDFSIEMLLVLCMFYFIIIILQLIELTSLSGISESMSWLYGSMCSHFWDNFEKYKKLQQNSLPQTYKEFSLPAQFFFLSFFLIQHYH